MIDSNLKLKLLNLCLTYVNTRISTIQAAIANASESANDDTKSSAGDKHETGRAMAQLEQEKCAIQLKEAQELKQILERINPENKSEIISLGSIVETDRGNFLISIAANKLNWNEMEYFAISPNSPIGKALLGNSEGAIVKFNENNFTIKKVY